jgi:hypothetical protein
MEKWIIIRKRRLRMWVKISIISKKMSYGSVACNLFVNDEVMTEEEILLFTPTVFIVDF